MGQQNSDATIEKAALKAFKNQPVFISVEGGRKIEIDDPEQAKAFKINLFKRSLGRKAEAHKPVLRVEAEARIRQRQPSLATVSWEDLSGKHESTFVIEDPAHCKLKSPSSLEVQVDKLSLFACLKERSFIQKLSGIKRVLMSLELMPEDDHRWTKLVNEAIDAVAIEQFIKEKS
jgi:hypothetical protein